LSFLAEWIFSLSVFSSVGYLEAFDVYSFAEYIIELCDQDLNLNVFWRNWYNFVRSLRVVQVVWVKILIYTSPRDTPAFLITIF